MLQKLLQSVSQPFREVFGVIFKWWLFIFVTILVPLDFLYRYSVLVSTLPPLQIVASFSSIVIFFTIFALIISLLSLVAVRVCTKFSLNGAELVNEANAFLGILFVGITLSDYLCVWIRLVASNSNIYIYIMKLPYLLRYSLMLILFGIFIITIIVFIKKYNHIFKEIILKPKTFYKINAFIVILCIIFSLYSGSFSFYINHKEYNSIALANKNKLESFPNIILVTFDALAAGHTSLYGHHYKTTPNLDKLSHKSYVFDNMFSSCNWTLPSLSSLLDGKHPCHHGLINGLSIYYGYERNQNLPSVLKSLGYDTGVVWSNSSGCPWKNNLRGFDKILPYDTLFNVTYLLGFGANPWLIELIYMNRIYKLLFIYPKVWFSRSNQPFQVLRPEYSFAKASEQLTCLKKPFFLWVHVYPPHSPYIAGDGFIYSILKQKIFDTAGDYWALPFPNPYYPKDQPKVNQFSMRYDEHICYVDNEFGKFLSLLNEKGYFNDSILIISSDHGEMFEKGYWGHAGPFLHQPLIHVPLIIHLPGQVQGQRIGANVSLVDIAPTILDFLGVTPPKWMDGTSFSQALKNSNFDTGTKFSMNLSFVGMFISDKLKTKSIAAIRGNYKLIKYLDWDRYELYDLKNDPQEQINLIGKKPEIFSSLKVEIDHTLRR